MSTQSTMTITNDIVVSMTYVLTNDKGDIVDESGDSPLVYLHGHHNIVPGLEQALEGLAVGARKTVSVLPSEGYGEYDPKMKFDVPRARMGDDVPPVDAMVQLKDGSGHTYMARVASVDDEKITFDANHPLAGETLNFDVTITELRAALPEELSHGHVHGPGGHHH